MVAGAVLASILSLFALYATLKASLFISLFEKRISNGSGELGFKRDICSPFSFLNLESFKVKVLILPNSSIVAV